jgi:hypothetical protein
MDKTLSQTELRRRLGPADVQQIRLLLHVPPEQRIQTMLDMQDMVLNMWYMRLRKAYPEISKMDLTRLVFQRIYKHGKT